MKLQLSIAMAENPRTRPIFQGAVTWGLFVKAIGILLPVAPLWMP